MTGVLLILVIAMYFLPTILAAVRKHPSVGAVAVINVFFGWTVVGWILALAKAAGNATRGGVVIQQSIVQHGGPPVAGGAGALAPDPGAPEREGASPMQLAGGDT